VNVLAWRILLCATLSAAAFSCATAREAARAGSLQLTPCAIQNADEQVLCGRHTVFEDRAAGSGRRISLNVVVIPALTATPRPDPIFVLAGGPGIGAASSAQANSGWLPSSIRRERAIVFVDQRGTGASNRHVCAFGDDAAPQTRFNDLFPIERVRACREALTNVADVKLYTTPIAMDDLDDIRAALGYRKINLYGASYGTQAALQYLRQYPARVRSMALAGVATPAAKQPLNFARAAQEALDRLIEACAADGPCRTAFPSFATELGTLLASLEHTPTAFQLSSPTTARSEAIRMSRGVFVERLRLMLYEPHGASRVPLVVHRAAQGDWAPFARLAPAGVTTGVSAMYLTVTCAETAARITDDDIRKETTGTFVSDYRTLTHLRACAEWPKAHVPANYFEPVKSDVPMLLLSGELDGATPARWAADAARSLPNSRQLIVPNTGHAYGHPCLDGIVGEFFAKGSARDLDVACVQTLQRPPFVIELP
jgi:pimeloyl-ACP methyl ester carboxylesterase